MKRLLTGPVIVQMACSSQPPFTCSTHRSAGEQTYPSPEKPFQHVQFTFSPFWEHWEFFEQPPFQNLHISVTGNEGKGKT